MKYKKIWDKTLNSDEEVLHEFSLGKQYLTLNLIVWSIVSIIFFFLAPALGVFVFLLMLFNYTFYAKVANAFAFTNKRLLKHKGWLSTKLISIDYDKITDVTVNEPFLDRVFTQSGNLIVNTAGSGSQEAVLRHVEKPYELKKKLDSLRSR